MTTVSKIKIPNIFVILESNMIRIKYDKNLGSPNSYFLNFFKGNKFTM
jgi:hypothetical protein